MPSVHMMLQAKGGVGKSTCVALLAQYLKDHLERPALCLDTDPSNKTFTAWRSLGVKHIDIAVAGDLEKSRFDLVVAEIAASDRDVAPTVTRQAVKQRNWGGITVPGDDPLQQYRGAHRTFTRFPTNHFLVSIKFEFKDARRNCAKPAIFGLIVP